MNLSNLLTTTTVEFSPDYEVDEVIIDNHILDHESERVIEHLNRIRNLAGIEDCAKVVSRNAFPSGTGLSSSASGFAALTYAATTAASLNLSEKELSILARQGSGSACRSIPDGFVEWVDGDTSDTSYARTLYPSNYWKLYDIVAVVSEEKKSISTSEGQTRVETSPFFEVRKKNIPHKIHEVKSALANKDFEKLGEISEREALEMHAVMLTSWPSLIYWTEGTLKLMKQIQHWRLEGMHTYFTINTGQDIHILCEESTKDLLLSKLQTLSYVRDTIVNYPSKGATLVEHHLF